MSHELQIMSSRISPSSVALPEARSPISIRKATSADIPFIDALQKKNNKAVGWMPFVQLESYVGKGKVLVAEERHGEERHEGT